MLPNNVKPVAGYEGYFVTNDGVVYSTAWGKIRRLSAWVNSNGYLSCKAGRKQLPVHRAVAIAWVENNLNATDVNHIDGNKLNNSFENLEWVSRKENLYHALRNGLHSEKETPITATNIDTGEVIHFISQASVNEAGFSQPNVNKCLKGLRPTHKRYRWEYDEDIAS